MVPIMRPGKAEQRLQQAMDRGRGDEVAPARDVRHTLQRVVDHHRQVIARGQIASLEDDIAPNLRRRAMLRGNGALAIFSPAKIRRRGVERAPHVEAERGPIAVGEAVARMRPGERAAGSGVERRAIRVAPSVRGARDLRAVAKTGVDKAALIKARERRRIVVAMLALPARRRGKAKSKPGQIVSYGRLELRLAAHTVQVLNAQEHASAQFVGEALVDEGGISVAEMERAVRRRRETQDRRARRDVIAHGG